MANIDARYNSFANEISLGKSGTAQHSSVATSLSRSESLRHIVVQVRYRVEVEGKSYSDTIELRGKRGITIQTSMPIYGVFVAVLKNTRESMEVSAIARKR